MKCYLVSACLLGARCRYDGESSRWQLPAPFDGTEYIPVCPESCGGLPIPRPPAEIIDGDGDKVLAGRARVIDREGTDRTEAFLSGARQLLEIACAHQAAGAVLKARSPSCGKGRIYDGSFSNTLKDGHGVAAALLLQNGIPVWTEKEWTERMNQQ